MGILSNHLDNLDLPVEPKREYIGASAIGHPCWRKLWLDYYASNPPAIDNRTRRIFDVGKILEGYIIGLLKQVVRIKDSNDELIHPIYPWFRGTVDGYLIDYDAILEIKTANHASFQRFVKHGLRSWNEQYFAQVQAYMGLSGEESAFVLVFNKNTAQFHDEKVKFDYGYYDRLEMKAQAIQASPSPPPRISTNPLFYLCKMCGHKKSCHDRRD